MGGGGADWQGAGIRPHLLLTAAVTRLWLGRRSRGCGWEGGHEAVVGKAEGGKQRPGAERDAGLASCWGPGSVRHSPLSLHTP